MARLCEGRVAIVTGAGRGVGREHAIMLAAHGAKVVVNDLGAKVDGTGADAGPANEVVETIKKAGGEAVANGDDVSSWDGAKNMIDQAVKTYGKLDVLVNNAGILRDRMLVQHDRAGMGRRHQGAPEGHLLSLASCRRVLARQEQGNRQAGERPHHQHLVDLRPVRQHGPDQLRRGQGRHRRVLDHRRARTAPHRRHGECDLAERGDAHDRRPARAHRGAEGRRRSEVDRAGDHLSRQRGIRKTSPRACSTSATACSR